MRALGYIRVSTAEQGREGHSLELQRHRLEAWCTARGLTLVDVIVDEGVSAGRELEQRKGGAELLRRMGAGEADVVVVVALDRIFRNAQDGINTLRGFGGSRPLELQSVTEPVDTFTAMGRFILTIWLARAELEREMTCERNAATTARLRRRGRPYGHVPFGCVSVGGMKRDDGKVVGRELMRCPVTWPQRELLVRLRTPKAEGGEGCTLAQVADALHAQGIKSPRGEPRWDRNTIARVVASHDGLKHLPMQPAAPETAVTENAA